MSAQSSARSKRRQSALFSSKNLLPVPQLSFSSITTSTPARGNQKHIPAPLPTPQPYAGRLLSTPVHAHNDNTSVFGFSPGAEADETALLAVDYRSISREGVASDQQLQDDLFEETAILEQRAFSNRRTSHEGDQSSGGLGALIFSNLIAGNQAHDALERLELGRRRDSENSRRSERISPFKRNASYTVSTGGEYLVDYETDVRFGDDLLDGFGVGQSSPDSPETFPQPASLSPQITTSLFAKAHTPISLQYSPASTVSRAHQDPPEEQAPQSPTRASRLNTDRTQDATLSPGPVVRTPPLQNNEESLHDDCQQDAVQIQYVQPYSHLESPGRSPAGVHSTVYTPVDPSPSMAERRQARRALRGLTASMAILLSPVAEDRDREKSMSRSRSMLMEALEKSHLQGVEACQNEAAPPTMSIQQDHAASTSTSEPQPEDLPAEERMMFTQLPPPTSKHDEAISAKPIPLASVLEASLSQNSIRADASIGQSSIQVPSVPPQLDGASKNHHSSRRKATARHKSGSASLKSLSAAKPADPALPRRNRPEVSRSASVGPSYLKPTLSRSIQQRESVSLKRSISASQTGQSVFKPVVRKTPGDRLGPGQPSKGMPSAQAAGPSSHRVRVACAPIPSSSEQRTASLAKERSVDDLFERRQRDGYRAPIITQPKDEVRRKAAVAERRSDLAEKMMQPEPKTALIPAHVSTQDEALTVPRGFAFAQNKRERKRARPEEDRIGIASTVVPTSTRPIPVRKARRVLPQENERLDDGDPEIGANVPLTSAALAAQDYALETVQVLEEEETNTVGPSESFDRTTQSQMLQRYLRELAAIEASQNMEPDQSPAVQSQQPIRTTVVEQLPMVKETRPATSAVVVEPQPKRKKLDANVVTSGTSLLDKRPCERRHQESSRAPLGLVSGSAVNQAKDRPTSAGVKATHSAAKAHPAADSGIRIAPKVTDFTFKVVGQQQTSFQERLAAWQAREAEAARSGKPILQPLALPAKDPAKQARKADKPTSSKRKPPVTAKEFNWHSDKRAKERRDWEERLREKEEILAELAEIRRLEAEAAEMEAIRRMRAAQVPIAHPVPSFARSKRQT